MKDSKKVVSRKLQLSRTTLRALSPEALAQAAGGTLVTRTGSLVTNFSQVILICEGGVFDPDPEGRNSKEPGILCTRSPGPSIVILPPPY